MAGPLIVTAELGAEDLAWLDRLRRTHFPPERNVLRAHLTMFHALPPSLDDEARQALAGHARQTAPRASIEGVMGLGGGVAFRVVSPELDGIREALQATFHGMLTAQDNGGWRPHVTIQNKVAERDARLLAERLRADFRPVPLAIRGLGLHRYLGGPWETLATYHFRGIS
jgi:hypothetical protein